MTEPIAIIGMGCRFPAAPDLQAFWQLMCNEVDAITEVPADRFDINTFYHPRPATPGKMMSRWGGFLDQVDQFDATFFGVSPREATRMDPQHRLLLEIAWEAMEDAGQVPEKLSETLAGVFMGVITSDYWDRQFRNPVGLDVYSTTGSARSGAAGHISYALGLQGISVAVDAACSSSLVAVHLACQSLRAGSCSLALAGGVNIILNPDHAIGYSQGKMMAPDGHCKTFDAQANGYVRSEGAGIVVLKPLALAQADGDPIYAIIRGSAANNDGHNDLFMTPSVKGQQAVLHQAYRNANTSPGRVQYVEAHGTGTSVGDPIELKALGSVLAEDRPAHSPCIVGSVKTNIGHTEGAAGLAGLIKVALCLKHKAIPANLHFHDPNPAIPWSELPLVVSQKLQPWPQSTYPHLAGVSSFGIAGTNAHIVLQEAPCQIDEPPTPPTGTHLLTLSAHTTEALKQMAQNYYACLLKHNGADHLFQDICYTTNVHRTHHDHRLAIVSHSLDDASSNLEAFLRGEIGVDVVTGRKIASHTNKMVWIFPGQGSQWLGMGKDLLEQEPVFRATLKSCDLAMQRYIDWSLLDQLQAEKAESRLEQVDVVQPMIFAIQVALAALWHSWGIEPDAVIGHSMGEVAAAYVAGALNLDDAARIICGRSQLLYRTSSQGAMAAVELSFEQAQLVVRDYEDRISIAVSNSPNSTVLSGDPIALAEILAQLEQRGVFGRLVNVNVASHSPQMDALREDLLDLMAPLQPEPSMIPIYSTVTGTIAAGEEFNASYWVRNLRMPVLFLNSVQQALQDGYNIFLEISPHPLLTSAIKQTIQYSRHSADIGNAGNTENAGHACTVLASLQREEEGHIMLLRTLATLYTQGYSIAWDKLYPQGGKRRVSLPNYPWQRERFWNTHLEESYSCTYTGESKSTTHPMLGSALQSALHPGTYFWETALDSKRFPYLQDHCIHGMVVLPSTGYIEIALTAATEVFGSQPFSLEDILLKKALFFPKDATQLVQVIVTPGGTGRAALQIFCSQPCKDQHANEWLLYASAAINLDQTLEEAKQRTSPEQAQREWAYVASATEHYQGLRKRGIEHGPLFQGITHIWQDNAEAMAQIVIPEALASELHAYQFHPALLDICLQGIMSLLPEGTEEDTYVPIGVKKVKLHRQPEPDSKLWSHTIIKAGLSADTNSVAGDIVLTDEHGQLILEVEGFRLQHLDSNPQRKEKLEQLLYTLHWEPTAHTGLSTTQSRKHWLIFSENAGAGQHLTEQLQAHGASCVVVHPGQAYKQITAQRYEVDPNSPTAFRQLLADAFGNNASPCQGIVYLWGMSTSHTETSLRSLEADQKLGSIAAAFLIQAITAAQWSTLPRLWLVTRGAQAINETEQIVSLSQSPLWGLGRVVVYEHPDLHCTLVDMDPTCAQESTTALFQEIWSDTNADEIALRGHTRFVARLDHYQQQANPKLAASAVASRVALEENRDTLTNAYDYMATGTALTLPFRSDGTYLITGGLGGIGLKVASWMIEQGVRHIALIGRSGPSAATELELDTMKASGAQIRIIKVDVARKKQLAYALAEIRQCMPPLRGVFHSAVVLDDSILLQLNQERFLAVMRPKIDGAWNLHELTLDQPLDAFVLFSSAASLIGSPGQGNYAAANAFMDALAHYRKARGYPALSINWGRWAEVGQATIGQRGQRLSGRGFASMAPQDGLTILGNLLQQDAPQVGVMSFNLRKWSQFYPKACNSSLFATLAQEEACLPEGKNAIDMSRVTHGMLQSMDTQQRRQAAERYLCTQVARVLGLSAARLDKYQQLNRLGIDSLMSVELKNRIAADLHVTVPVATFLQGITLDQLTILVLQRL